MKSDEDTVYVMCISRYFTLQVRVERSNCHLPRNRSRALRPKSLQMISWFSIKLFLFHFPPPAHFLQTNNCVRWDSYAETKMPIVYLRQCHIANTPSPTLHCGYTWKLVCQTSRRFLSSYRSFTCLIDITAITFARVFSFLSLISHSSLVH